MTVIPCKDCVAFVNYLTAQYGINGVFTYEGLIPKFLDECGGDIVTVDHNFKHIIFADDCVATAFLLKWS